MEKFFLLGAALILASISLLTQFRAPDTMTAWKVAILAGEFGHWLAFLAVALVVRAGFAPIDGWRWPIVIASLVAGGFFLRPTVMASRIAATLPASLQTAFGNHKSETAPLSWPRLFGGSPIPSARMITVQVGSPDGNPLPADLYLPADGSGLRPCVIVIHGGGWDGGDRRQLPAWNHWMASRGYVVAAVSYRLAPRWKWPAQRDDILEAVAWLKAHASEYGIDPRRFVLFGRSAGGQIATAVAYGARDESIRGAVALYAPQDMPFVWSVSREDDALNSLNLMRQYMGGPPDEAGRAEYESASAQLLARRNSPPTLLVHGDPDTLSWVRHSERLSSRLSELGVPHYFLRLPWATHAFDFNLRGPGGQLTAYTLDWFLESVTRS